MSDDFEIMNGNTRIRVQGLSATVRKLQKAGADSQSMSALMHEIGMIVVRAAVPPRVSGTLAGTLRAGKGKTKAVVRAGGAKAPYAGVIHYGWPARNIRPQPFFTYALQRKRGEAVAKLDQGIGQILKKNDLT